MNVHTEPASADPTQPARRDAHKGEGATRGTNRMEAYADAVFAIAFTLPIVGIVLPDPAGTDPRLGEDLLNLWPSYLGYLIASFIIGMYWVHHHFSGAIYRTTGHWFLVATVVFLAVIGFVAFPSRVFAEHISDPAAREAATEYLVLTMTLLSWSWLLKWTVGWKRCQVDGRLEQSYVRRLNRRYWWFTVLNSAAAVLVLIDWRGGLFLSTIVTLSLLIPPETPKYHSEAPIVEGEG